jgi:hypothetical protein
VYYRKGCNLCRVTTAYNQQKLICVMSTAV